MSKNNLDVDITRFTILVCANRRRESSSSYRGNYTCQCFLPNIRVRLATCAVMILGEECTQLDIMDAG